MTAVVIPRPKRLWVVAIMNIAVALITLVILLVMLISDRVPMELRPTGVRAAASAFIAALLILSSIFALLRYPKARWLTLSAALIFFGLLLLQSLILVVFPGDALPEGSAPRLWANVVRNAIEISLNLWVFLSRKIAAYFGSAEVPT